MTRRWFFQALAGATALIGSAKRLVAKPKLKPTPVVEFFIDPSSGGRLKAGDRLSVRFEATPTDPFVYPTFIIKRDDGNPDFYASAGPSAPGETFWIAAKEMVITDCRVHFSGNPAPILWTKTSAGK